jgi:geranylgeranyl diphosphate synthase type II
MRAAQLPLDPLDRAFLERRLARERQKVEKHLARLFAGRPASEIERACRYTVRAGGKRLRPVLMVAASRALGAKGDAPYDAGLSIELIHSYSLIHDDLPQMDDDDYRRGKPTCHRVFGPGTALLAGVALIGLATQNLLRTGRKYRLGEAVSRSLAKELLEASGTGGLIGGQAADILAESKPFDRDVVDYIPAHKTAALFGASAAMGAILGRAGREKTDALRRYGTHAGIAFQIVDDILDQTGSFEDLGKRVRKDAGRGKATYPALYGIEGARRKASKHASLAVRSILEAGVDDRFLRHFPYWILIPVFSPGGSAH